MTVERLDHVNVRTAQLEPMRRFYCDVLGLTASGRDSPQRRGYGLGVGDDVFIHLIEATQAQRPEHPQLEHFAMRAAGLGAFLARLEAADIAYSVSDNPGDGVTAVNVRDPDGNRLHLDFPISEPKPAEMRSRVAV